ncbi:hypothetical protein A7985_10720 [Pseudoalteromonas luteoviolacea]|uniref:Uncharacterized protein n=1 Tax=Pseudoalteromonas luteoviolacea TaxID=43657 RepID=A0A1C0TSN5_9GAMM|nr:hypothetical protein [Pseudoalteromonas luteoviolacea]OCQ22247.1 hypothetical protein A7985_10720 [Pseudoalteromonas luteoviolacea]
MSVESAMSRLGYSVEWLSLGILTEDYILAQYAEIENSEDKNAEHYRCGAFTDYLNSKKELTDFEVHNVFKLRDNGPDNCNLHEDRIIQLIHVNILSDDQLNLLEIYPEVLKKPIQKRYFRELLIRKVNRTSIDDCFFEIKETRDSYVQGYILTLDSLLPKHVIWLQENGINRRVRNVAKQLYANRKFMGSSE